MQAAAVSRTACGWGCCGARSPRGKRRRSRRRAEAGQELGPGDEKSRRGQASQLPFPLCLCGLTVTGGFLNLIASNGVQNIIDNHNHLLMCPLRQCCSFLSCFIISISHQFLHHNLTRFRQEQTLPGGAMAPAGTGGGFHSSIRRAVLQTAALRPHVLPG